jgi:hypothetical protein
MINKSLLWCATHGHYKFGSIMNILHKMRDIEVCINSKYETFMYVFWTVVNMHKICMPDRWIWDLRRPWIIVFPFVS